MSMYRISGAAGRVAVDWSEGYAEQPSSRIASPADLRVAMSLLVLTV